MGDSMHDGVLMSADGGATADIEVAALFSAVAEGSPAGVAVFRRNGADDFALVYANRAYVSLCEGSSTGAPLDDIVGRHTAELRRDFERVLDTGHPLTLGSADERKGLGAAYSSIYRAVTASGDCVVEVVHDPAVAGVVDDYRKAVEQLTVTDAMRTILEEALRADDDSSLAALSLEVLKEITGAQLGFIAEKREDGGVWTTASDGCQGRTGHPGAHTASSDSPWPDIRGLPAEVLATGYSLISNDPESHPGRVGVPAGHPPLESFLGVPLRASDDGPVAGLVGLANRPGGFGLEHCVMAEAIAPAIVESLQRFRAERDLAESARLADDLLSIERMIHATLDFEAIAQEALRAGCSALHADSAALSRYSPPHFEVLCAVGFEPDITGIRIPQVAEEHSVLAIETREPVIIENVRTDARVDAAHVSSFGIEAVVVAPLVLGGRAFGNVYYNFASPRRFSEAEIRFVRGLSLSLSLAMENARLYESEREVASRLQAALLALPDANAVDGIIFSHAYHSATESTRVGGDFYDIFEMSGNRIGITIGDVAGKGLDAAALTSLVKNTIRAHAVERTKTPAEVLQLTNEVVYRGTELESYVTLCFGVLDCRDGRFVYCNAGHTVAALVRRNLDIARLGVTSPILGAFSTAMFRDSEAWLDVDDSVFLYTDGLTECRGGEGFFGEERVFEALAAAESSEPYELLELVVQDALAFTDCSLRDDLAILAVKRCALAQEGPRQERLPI